jgi:hypothetical protein
MTSSESIPSAGKSSLHNDEPSGLYSGFDAYRTATADDYFAVLTTGMVVPDTNVLLNLYRYNAETRHDLFEIFQGLRDRLWVPHQVIAEFWRNRELVLQDPRDMARTLKELSSLQDKAMESVRSWASRVGLSRQRVEEVVKSLVGGFESATASVERLAGENQEERSHVGDTNLDPILAELEPILRGRVGSPLDNSEVVEAIAEAKKRRNEKRPPGYTEGRMTEESGARDYLLWLQILLQAKSQHRDVLLVTGDVKEDWWRRERGQLRGPRPELVEELRNFAGVRLFILRPEGLLVQVRQVLHVQVRNESVQDVETVDRIWEADSITVKSSSAEAVALQTETLRATWTNVIEEVRKSNRQAWLLLKNSEPIALHNNVLTVNFKNAEESRLFIESGYDQLLSNSIYRLFAINVRVKTSYPSLQGSEA